MKELGFGHFWRYRNSGDPVWLDRYTVNNAAVILAYLSYQIGATPNRLSLASGLSGILVFAVSLWLPTESPALSILTIYLLAQVSYAFDCADGQLARAIGKETEFGEFLDKSIDTASNTLCFGALFAYLYRLYSTIEQTMLVNFILFVGFLFILVRTSRFFALHKYRHMFNAKDRPSCLKRRLGAKLTISFMDHQASLFAILAFLYSSYLGLSLFICQTIVLGVVYLRYFIRAYSVDRN